MADCNRSHGTRLIWRARGSSLERARALIDASTVHPFKWSSRRDRWSITGASGTLANRDAGPLPTN